MSTIPAVDLRPISRDSSLFETKVYVYDNFERHLWIVAGESSLVAGESSLVAGNEVWTLKVLGLPNVRSSEHEPVYVLGFEIVGLTFKAIHRHRAFFTGWLNATDAESFNVPEPGYNPAKSVFGVEKCEDPKCGILQPHVIVPDGYFFPRPNPVRFKQLRGKKVDIIVGRPETGEEV